MVVITLSVFNFPAAINSDWKSGFHHPLEGWDHLLTMITVGIWAAQLRGHAIWLLPLAFVGVMSLGGLAGAAGLAIPSVEGLILLSCAVFSILIIRRTRFSTQVSVMIVAFFAFFHGFAHGQEISTSASLISYTLGFVLATLLLHGAGIIVAKLVVLSITCLVAIFFSSMAQANQFDSKIGLGSKNASHVNIEVPRFSRNLQVKKIGQRNYAATLFALADHRLCPDDHRQETNIINSDSTRHTVTYDLTSRYGKSSTSTIGHFHFGLILNKTLDLADESLSQDRRYFYSVNIHDSRIEFKHYYPDINHSPGKDFLSNGVGLTSPPAFSANRAFLHNSSLFRHTPISSFEAYYLQMTVANLTFGNCSYCKTTFSPVNRCAIRYRLNTGNNLQISERYKHNFSVYLTSTSLIFHPYGSASAAAFDFDRLPTRKRVIKNRINNIAAIYIQT
ncbi:MAG: HupE/UreJ family protein [Methylococcaceae bacterium]|nr:HupE/UreJ family protein [Methylococcaceae bacterium]